MAFDEKAYEKLLIPYARKKTIPEDLFERYAITLPAKDDEIAAQIKAVRLYWNKKMRGNGNIPVAARSCDAADKELKKDKAFETARWWQERRSKRDQEARDKVNSLADLLRKDHGTLEVVTAAALGKAAASLGLTMDQAEQAAAQAKLTVIAASVTLPDKWPIKAPYDELRQNLRDGGASSVPDLIHPESGPFRILAGYACVGDANKRLDVDAIKVQATEAGKNTSPRNTARSRALGILKDAKSQDNDQGKSLSVILGEVTLYLLAKQVEDVAGDSPSVGKQQLVDCGVESGDAAKIVALLAGRAKAARESDLDRVRAYLENGQLGEAKSLLGTLAGDKEASDEATQLAQAVATREQELASLKARVAQALRQPDEALAYTLLREIERISKDDAAAELRNLPLAPAVQPSATGDGPRVEVFWKRGAQHDESTVYAVRRKVGQAPAAETDGDEVYLGPGTQCADPGAPVATPVTYGIFALAGEGRPASRPVTTEVTAAPPVWDVREEVGTDTVTLSWAAHQDAEVEVTRAQGVGGSQLPVPVTGNGCQVTGLPEGVAQYFEIVAAYRGPGGTRVTSKPSQVNVKPLGSAKPILSLKVTSTVSDGQVRAVLAWRRIDNSEVRILRTDAEPPWPEGTFITREEAERAGQFLAGRVDSRGSERTMETGLADGIHYLTPLSEGGTGIVVGRPQSIAMTSPVQNLAFTPFADYATISWEWPRNVQMAEVRWRGDEEQDWDFTVLTLAEYQSRGVKVPLGAKPVKVEVCTLIPVGTRHHASPPAAIEVPRVLEVSVRYQVSGGALTGRSRKVTFTVDAPCSGVHVQMVASPGGIMPTKPASNAITVLDTTLDLVPGVPAEHKVSIPKMAKPYWVRCFIVGGPGRLIDPPYKNLKED